MYKRRRTAIVSDRATQTAKSDLRKRIQRASAWPTTKTRRVEPRRFLESGSGGEAFVAMVKSADLRNRDHLAVARGPDWARGLGLVGVALAQNAGKGTAPLVHVNSSNCQTTPGTKSGVVKFDYNAKQNRSDINISVQNAEPDITYLVYFNCYQQNRNCYDQLDGACYQQIGSLTTNSSGTGRARIKLTGNDLTGAFFIDMFVPPNGDTFIAGPLSVQ